jgi:hypothetical protein
VLAVPWQALPAMSWRIAPGYPAMCCAAGEVSSESIVPAQYQMLCRAIDALEAEGVRFSDSGVRLQRPAPVVHTVIHSEAAA